MGFSRQEYWSGLACPPPGDLPNLGIEPESLMSLALAGGFFFFFTTTASWEAQHLVQQEPRQLQSAPREPYNKPLLSPRPICLLHRPNKQVQWGCGGNPHPYFFLVLDGGSNLQEPTISFIFPIYDKQCPDPPATSNYVQNEGIFSRIRAKNRSLFCKPFRF